MQQKSDYAVVFPGRDAFYRGMCPSFYRQYRAFREIFDAACDYMGEDLYAVSYIDSRQRPELHTVCLITHCYGVYRLFIQHMNRPLAAAGFSQGEFTAVAAGGGTAFPEVLKLIYELELLVMSNKKIHEGRMVRVVDLNRNILSGCCKEVDPETKQVQIAIYLSERQNIISGDKKKVREVCDAARRYGARWIIPLETGGTFHSPLCREILVESGPVFNRYDFTDTEYDVYSCADGTSSLKAAVIKNKLQRQIAVPILWDTIIVSMQDRGIKKIFELGPGCTVSGNSRMAYPDCNFKWINHVWEMEELFKKTSVE